MINKEEVKHIAKLARLGTTEREIEKFQVEISSILDYIEKLEKVDVSQVQPTSHSVLMENIMREDKAGARENYKKILDSAPETKGDFIKVKPIF